MLRVPAQAPNRIPARIVFVGEAPSNEELEQGKPFVGPAGRIFNSILRVAGMNRAEFGVTNVFDEKLPENSIKHWVVPSKEAKAAKIDTIPPIAGGYLHPDHRGHLDRLAREIKEWQPNVIVPLGGTALWAFTGQTGITSYRGTVMPATLLTPGAKLVPSFHPQAVQYQWKLFTVVVRDFLKAYQEANRGPEIIYPERRLYIEPTLADLVAWEPLLVNTDLLSVDVETYADQITCISFAPSVRDAYVIPFFDKRNVDRNYWRTVFDEATAWKFVRRVLASPVPKLGQNFTYDTYRLLGKYHIAPRNYLHDTRLLHHAIYPELPKDLGFMGSSYTSQGAWKHWGKKGDKKDD